MNNGGFQFTYKGKDAPKSETVRRQKKRLLSSVSGPADHSAKKAKLALEEKIRSGEIDIGKNVVEKVIQKRGYDKTSGRIVVNTFTIYARKHALRTLRVKFFNKYKKFMRLNPDPYFDNISKEELVKRFKYIGETTDASENLYDLRERLKAFERTRSLQLWHDGSCITNHGHILFCIDVLYDCAVFYTSSEYEQKFNVKKDIQRLVETPELYLIGRCANNDEQLGYIETRVSCLKELKNGMNLSELDESCENIVLNDTMRFFHGDGPAAALEAGNQKGGNYFCPSCDVHLCLTDDITHCYQQKVKSLAEKQHKVLQGKFGRIKRRTLPFEKLDVSQLEAELNSRNVDLTKLKSTKKDLVPQLKKALRGIKRVPILLLHNPVEDLSQMGLARYEIVMVECMHDIANHIDNILEELPTHLNKKGDDKMFSTIICHVF